MQSTYNKILKCIIYTTVINIISKYYMKKASSD